MANTIEVRDLTKVYGEGQRGVAPVLAVDHISFSVRSGEIFGFLGPNGAGKTTTHRMLSRLLEPTGGTIRIEGTTSSVMPTRPRDTWAWCQRSPTSTVN